MKKLMAFVLILILFGLGVVVASWIQQANAQGTKNAVVWPAAEVKWSDNPVITGAKIAVLWGDPKTGAYGSLKKIPAGSKLALHTHTQDQKVIAITGTIVLTSEGGAPKELGPASYAFIPGGSMHTADCRADVECTYFEEQPGASDIKFVQVSHVLSVAKN